MGEVVGEVLLGLPRALFQAGCATSIVASWGVEDDTACKLMESMYRRLLHGWTVARALRFAMVTTCTDSSGKLVCPALWAPFQIVGIPAVRLCEGTATWPCIASCACTHELRLPDRLLQLLQW